MKLYEFTNQTIEEMLAEIDRRGFLKGLGAAAGLAALGKTSDVLAKPGTFQDVIDHLKKYGEENNMPVGSYNYVHVDTYANSENVIGWVRYQKGKGVQGFVFNLKQRKLQVYDPRLQMFIDLARQGYDRSDNKIKDGKF